MNRVILIGTLLLLDGWAAWSQGGPEPSVTFDDPVVAIGAAEGASEIGVQLPPGEEPINLTDAGFPKPTAVTFTPKPTEMTLKGRPAVTGPNGETTWRYVVEVNKLPSNATQKRLAIMKMKVGSKTLDYWLTNHSPALTVTKLDHWVIRDLHPWDESERCKSIMVYSGDIPGTNAHLLQANVEREAGRESIDLEQLYICGKDPCKRTESIDLEAHKAKPLQLCLGDRFLWPGKYAGTLWLGTTQKPDGQSIDLTFYVRDRLLRFLGLALIVTGVWGSWWLKVRTRPQLNRLQALAPAAHLQQQFAKLGLRLDRLPEYLDSLPRTQEEIKAYEGDLSEEALEGRGFLPPRPPAPINAPQPNVDGYRRLMETASSLLDVLAVVVDGVEEVKKLDSANPPTVPVVTALSQLDRISAASPLPSRDAAQGQVDTILATLKTTPADLQKGRAVMKMEVAPPAKTPTYQSYEQIQIKIRQLNSGFWWAWAVLTVLTGFAFLILNNPLFGTPLDLATAFVWGFGIPTLLGTVASSSVATALGITVPQI
jgi:hypothetical protein